MFPTFSHSWNINCSYSNKHDVFSPSFECKLNHETIAKQLHGLVRVEDHINGSFKVWDYLKGPSWDKLL